MILSPHNFLVLVFLCASITVPRSIAAENITVSLAVTSDALHICIKNVS